MLPLPRAYSLPRLVATRDGNITRLLSQLDFVSSGQLLLLLGRGGRIIDDVDLVSHDNACVIGRSSVAGTELRILA